mgnify:CR=1 FL=1
MEIDGIEKVKWKPYEIDIIKNNYKKISDRQIMQKFLPHRTRFAIATKRYEIACRKSIPKHQSELKEKFFLNKTLDQISGMRRHLGIRRFKTSRVKKRV